MSSSYRIAKVAELVGVPTTTPRCYRGHRPGRQAGPRSNEWMQRMVDRGTVCHSKREFIELLDSWLTTADDATIGDVGNFGGRAWVHVELGTYACHLNADSTRAGVREFVSRSSRLGDTVAWRAVANTRSVVNKIALDDGKPPIKGFYLYLDVPIAHPTVL